MVRRDLSGEASVNKEDWTVLLDMKNKSIAELIATNLYLQKNLKELRYNFYGPALFTAASSFISVYVIYAR